MRRRVCRVGELVSGGLRGGDGRCGGGKARARMVEGWGALKER